MRVPRVNAATRLIEDIAVKEIAQASYLCVRDCYALSREELNQQTAHLLGFKKTGIDVQTRIEEAFRVLENDKRVVSGGDSFSVA